MRYSRILVTGGAGFVGSNLAVSFKRKYPGLKVIALDNLKRRGSELNIGRLKQEGVSFIHGDIRLPEDLVLGQGFDLLIECSAEPSVLAGIDNPQYITGTNLSGTVNCLELARKNKSDLIFLSTSRVYPYQAINALKIRRRATRFQWVQGQKVDGWSTKGINEDFTTSGAKTLYGATKLASELLIQEYIANYGLKAVINRCGVIAGPWQFGKVDQGVFTYWMLAHYFRKNLQYIGFGADGLQVRDLLHIDDLFRLIDLQCDKISRISGKVYNIGGGTEVSLSLLEATSLCRKISGNKVTIAKQKKPRPGDISIFLTDISRAKYELGWQPAKGAEIILGDIHRWIKENESYLEGII